MITTCCSGPVNLASEHSEYAGECLDYSKADFDGIRSQLRDNDWDYKFTGTVQNSWDIFKAKLHELERRYVSKKQATLGKRKKWMTRKAMKLVEKSIGYLGNIRMSVTLHM